MDNFDEFIGNVKVAAEDIGKKANDYVEISKLLLERSTMKSDIQKSYAKIGELVYTDKNEGKNSDIIDMYIEELNSLNERLKEINLQIAKLRNKSICLKCGAENEAGAIFCSRCGASFEDEEDLAVTEDIISAEEETEETEE